MFGTTERGLSRLPDGRLLRDAMAEEPERFLGPTHASAFGGNPGVLVKLLDAGERLPVHWHPSRAFAREHLGLPNGKTEAWVVLEARPDSEVFLGWRRVDRAEIQTWLAEQDGAAVLSEMHRIEVASGDALLVPASTLHAIGEGILLVELQGRPIFPSCSSGRGTTSTAKRRAISGSGSTSRSGPFARMRCRTESSRSWRPVRATGAGPVRRLFPAAADEFFRADRVTGGAELDAGFSILVVTRGSGALESEAGRLEIGRGRTVLVPDEAGPSRLDGDVEGIRCRPPRQPPEAAS
jgi:mannose-6-phosphate isomerase